MALNVFGSAPASLVPFDEAAPSGDSFKPIEHIGASVIFSVEGPDTIATKYDPAKSVVRCAKVVVLDRSLNGEGKALSNIVVFATAIVDQLKNLTGQTTVATIGSYETKQGGEAPRLEAASREAIAAAEKYLAGK